MKNYLPFFLLMLSQLTLAEINPNKLIINSIETLGGIKLTSIQTEKISGIREQARLDLFRNFYMFTEERNYLTNELLIENVDIASDNYTSHIIVKDGVAALRRSNGNFFSEQAGKEEPLYLSAERILITAQNSHELKYIGRTSFFSEEVDEISFMWENKPVSLYIDPYNYYPIGYHIIRPLLDQWHDAGDAVMDIKYSRWTINESGFHYPKTIEEYKNGEWFATIVQTGVSINTELNSITNFIIPEDIKLKYKESKRTNWNNILFEPGLEGKKSPIKELAMGISIQPDQNIVTLIEDNNEIYIIEAPVSSAYSVEILESSKSLYPNKQIKGVIITSPIQPHISGVREYVNKNLPIYLIEEHKAAVQKILATPHKTRIDSFEKNPKKPKFTFVNNNIQIGYGENRMILVPSKTTLKRMMVYWPEKKILYCSELGASFGFPEWLKYTGQSLSEIIQVVEREKLDVDYIFGLHMSSLVKWDEIKLILNNP